MTDPSHIQLAEDLFALPTDADHIYREGAPTDRVTPLPSPERVAEALATVENMVDFPTNEAAARDDYFSRSYQTGDVIIRVGNLTPNPAVEDLLEQLMLIVGGDTHERAVTYEPVGDFPFSAVAVGTLEGAAQDGRLLGYRNLLTNQPR